MKHRHQRRASPNPKGDYFMKRTMLCSILIFATILLTLASPFAVFGEENKAKKEAAQTKPSNDVKAVEEAKPANAAIVNGTAIPYADFERELDLYSRRLQRQGMTIPDNLKPQVQKEVIDELISRELMYQESQKKKIKLEKDYVKNEIAKIKQRFPDNKQFEQMMSQMGMTESLLEEQIRRIGLIRGLIDKEVASKIKITDEEAKKFYDENPKYFTRPEEVHAQHILIKLDKDADDKAKKDARKKLEDLKKRAEKGEDFGELAKANSQGPSAPKGGDLGFFSKGKMVPSFEKAAFALKPGEISDVVETKFGYHLIKSIEHKAPETKSFDSVKDKIVENLRNRKVQDEVKKYIEGLRQKAKIETFVK